MVQNGNQRSTSVNYHLGSKISMKNCGFEASLTMDDTKTKIKTTYTCLPLFLTVQLDISLWNGSNICNIIIPNIQIRVH